MNCDLRLVIFDLDGTLIEFHHEYLFSQTERIIRKFGHPETERQVLEHHFSIFDYFGFVREDERDNFIEKFWTEFDWNSFPTPVPIEGVVDALVELNSKNIATSIATSRFATAKDIKKTLEPTNLLKYISHIVPRPGDHVHWTDKRAQLLEVCKLHQVDPSQAMMIGDIPPDIKCAKDVGIGLAVAVRSGGIKENLLQAENPDHIIESVKDILSVL